VSKGRSRDGVWKYSYGVRPYVVFAMERRDRAGHIAVRWTNPDKTGNSGASGRPSASLSATRKRADSIGGESE